MTPESFSDLPEYAAAASLGSRRMSVQSQASGFGLSTSSLSRSSTRSRTDPNTVVLDRFEDISPSSAGQFSIPSPGRRPSLPDSIQYLSISTSSPTAHGFYTTSPLSQVAYADEQCIAHFRQYVINRLVQPQLEGGFPGSTRDTFEIEAARFQPVSVALCVRPPTSNNILFV